jgi:hypothetical protein
MNFDNDADRAKAPVTLTDEDKEALAVALHHALRCNCDSGDSDRIVVEECLTALESLLAAHQVKCDENRAVTRRIVKNLQAIIFSYRRTNRLLTEALAREEARAEAAEAERARLRAQVEAVRAVIRHLKAASGSIHGPVVDEVRRSTGDWLDAALEGRLTGEGDQYGLRAALSTEGGD